MKDKCVCCDEYVPEGRQVCTNCEKTSIKDSGHRRQFDSGAVHQYPNVLWTHTADMIASQVEGV